MTRIDEAQERLATALTRLEKAARNRPLPEGALAEAEARYDRLQSEARAVSERLDRTIERVRGLLGR